MGWILPHGRTILVLANRTWLLHCASCMRSTATQIELLKKDAHLIQAHLNAWGGRELVTD